MPNVLRAATGQEQEGKSFTGPSSYPSGGFTHRSDMGRVDNVQAEVDDGQWDARASVGTDNDVIITVFSQNTAGNEAPDSTDLTGDTFTYQAYRL